jgi:hypothetical protein
VRVVTLDANYGSVAARCAGFELVRGRRTVTLDADLENLPEDVEPLLRALDAGHDLACGVREQRRDARFGRRLPSALLNAYARRRLGTHVRDIWCGMRAMDSRIVADLASEGDRRRSLTPLFLSRARSVAEVRIRHAAAADGSGYSTWKLAAIAADFVVGTAHADRSSTSPSSPARPRRRRSPCSPPHRAADVRSSPSPPAWCSRARP